MRVQRRAQTVGFGLTNERRLMRTGENGAGKRMIHQRESRFDPTVDTELENIFSSFKPGQERKQSVRTLGRAKCLSDIATVELHAPFRILRNGRLHQDIAA